jgi:4-amino-4-deoxy-L-arabinose transferase-like glycosyltransferase
MPAVLVTLVALALRLYRLNAQGAWVDEAFTIHAAAQPWNEMMAILISDYNHPPLHTALLWAWFDAVGVGVVQARLISVLAGTGAVLAIYWLAGLMFGRRTALVAAVLLAVSQLGILHAQEARAYALLLLVVSASQDSCSKRFTVDGCSTGRCSSCSRSSVSTRTTMQRSSSPPACSSSGSVVRTRRFA